ncbi:metallophosphoesterase [Trinickia caryophylli]|uniref:Calcineurin-like phosphoesterase n=1 Tax=Trinickia caryophylli TaxID=28094 RepID=A0A1X7CH12_TRICW|nr:metallophosphoesterase [Trinickia caryophylli]PMS11647.1 metallophosphoesterase [Trinickia caryophylli]TRX19866.1 metallophosphoesterase [Trinickia caryophylli]WQE12800.1 metallophosphoesterase [Trinickia caryophylli]SME96287.1 Calcineurin-like phosphoesterase [Trinickia caryophylli]
MDRGDESIPPSGRRSFLKCMALAGAGTLWLVKGGVPQAHAIGDDTASADASFGFVQISDSHIGFDKDPNHDVAGTFKAALERIGNARARPDFVVHTGDLTHLSQPAQFDTVAELMRAVRTQTFYVPGEHDVIGDNGAAFFERFGQRGHEGGWYSFDHRGVHFVSLVNVRNLKAGGLGSLGSDQLDWLRNDLAGRSPETPLVVFAHMPLWSLYPAWGWGTDDAAQALGLMRRFGSVTVLNGHVHQVQQKIEGNVTFHTARSTAYPQPAPGAAPSPGPLKTLPAGRLADYLGVRTVHHLQAASTLTLDDETLS